MTGTSLDTGKAWNPCLGGKETPVCSGMFLKNLKKIRTRKRERRKGGMERKKGGREREEKEKEEKCTHERGGRGEFRMLMRHKKTLLILNTQ